MTQDAAAQVATSLAGQQVVGTQIVSPWFPGAWEVTQGWGQTDYDGEPEGHGYAHWHAGVDIGLDSGTVVTLPAGLSGTAKAVDNPSGYGTALVVQLDSPQLDVWLGHNRQRFVADGEQLRAGMQLTATNSTGNSTGPHLHFEVRPRNGRYGTDLDPSALLLSGTPGAQTFSSSADVNPYNPIDPRYIVWEAQHGLLQLEQIVVGGGQVLLGGGMLLSGLLVAGYGLRGRTPQQLQSDVRRAIVRRPTPTRARPQRSPVGEAERTRLRPNLQRRVPTPRPGAAP